MNKKNIRNKNLISDIDGDDPAMSDRLLQTIQKKLDSSAALNGGFDRLLYKIDGIEKSQVEIVEKVDKIHDAIYHPDEGLFARIASNKASQIESVTKIEKELVEFSAWKKHYDAEGQSAEAESDEMHEKIIKIEKSLDDLEKFQSLAGSAAKWLVAAIAGAIFSYAVEIAYKLGK